MLGSSKGIPGLNRTNVGIFLSLRYEEHLSVPSFGHLKTEIKAMSKLGDL